MKLKTKKTAAKRFRVTKTGKILRRHSRTSHLKSKQTTARKRRKSKTTPVSKGNKSKVRKLVGR